MLQIIEEREEVMWKSGKGATTRAPVGAKNHPVRWVPTVELDAIKLMAIEEIPTVFEQLFFTLENFLFCQNIKILVLLSYPGQGLTVPVVWYGKKYLANFWGAILQLKHHYE